MAADARPSVALTATRMAGGIAFLVPFALLVGAYVGQYRFGLFPCEMCWWQRYPHFAALALALLATLLLSRGRLAVARGAIALAGLAILISGLIGGYHAGVEYGWWAGITECASTAVITGTGDEFWREMMALPVVRCDIAPFSLFGISLAGYNFLISCVAGIAIALLLRRGRERAGGSRVSEGGAAS